MEGFLRGSVRLMGSEVKWSEMNLETDKGLLNRGMCCNLWIRGNKGDKEKKIIL